MKIHAVVHMHDLAFTFHNALGESIMFTTYSTLPSYHKLVKSNQKGKLPYDFFHLCKEDTTQAK